ncbi:hypothetical protein HELRODRAFT_188591 [Helobdella robusta]|uniref:Doublecortin domain-containing protein n=1 Tax=Helobdella robusta TaxID=6412 RepID=T1FQ55_HELRO|nr:hypothetical protein HELRODRAFT_188591 [Helobdella robusta]ESO02139.1 hypothetical protein HELRODRAFT_188591 [Helobdella robusta]
MRRSVYANGDTAGPAQRVTMPWKGLDRLEALINEVDIRMKSRNLDARSLYTLDGHMITNINQLKPGGYYVAVGVGVKGFVKGDYGSVVKPHFYVPLNSGDYITATTSHVQVQRSSQFITERLECDGEWMFAWCWLPADGRIVVSTCLEERNQECVVAEKQSKGSIFYNSKNGTSENSVNGGSGSSSVRISPGSKKASSPQSDVTIKTSRSNKPQKPMYKSEGNLSFKQKSKQQQQQQQQQQKQQRIVTKEVDYDNDEGGIFKAKQQRRETKHAQVIREDHQTKVEMPVELMNADDVMEDIEYNKEHQSTGHRKGRPSNMEHEERSGHETRHARNDPHNVLLASHAEELDDIEKNNTYRIEDHDVEMANEDYENNVE